MRVAVGLALGFSAAFAVRRPVFCDAAISRVSTPSYTLNSGRTVDSRGVKRFNGTLDYHQLAIGSFTGMVTGWMAGKLSKVLVSLVFGSFLTLEYLQYTGSVDITPWANSVYQWGLDRINTELLLEDPSFKFSFISAFLVAAANS